MRWYLLPVLIFLSARAGAQVGGIAVYQFLDAPSSATVAALGGHHIALMDDDVTLAFRNPSLLNPAMHGKLALSHAFLPAGIHNSYLGYARHREELKTTFQAGLQYIGYGNDLIRRDPTGQDLGTFGASEFAATVGAARQVQDRVSVGVNLKLLASQLAGYNSLGIGLDAGVHYRDTSGRFQLSLVARNFGRQVTRYDDTREPMPFELQVGISRELKYLPFRFSVVYRYLDRWNVLYDDPNAEDNSTLTFIDDTQTQGRGAGAIFFDNLARHFVVSGELLIGKRRNLRARIGYNHGLRRELRLTDFRSGAGYSFGFAWFTRRFSIAYGRGTYHLGGGVNQLTLGTTVR